MPNRTWRVTFVNPVSASSSSLSSSTKSSPPLPHPIAVIEMAKIQIESIRPVPPAIVPTLREVTDRLDRAGLTNSERDLCRARSLIERAAKVDWISRLSFLERKNVDDIELEIWGKYALRITERLPPDGTVVELGMVKNSQRLFATLSAINKLQKNIHYYVFDPDPQLLRKGLAAVVSSISKFNHVRLTGLYGSFPDLLDWLGRPESSRSKPRVIAWMGSNFGSFDIQSMASFLRTLTKYINWGDQMLLGISAYTKADREMDSVGERPAGEYHPVAAALRNLQLATKNPIFSPDNWMYNQHLELATGFQESYILPRQDLKIGSDVVALKGDRFVFDSTTRYTPTQLQHLWAIAGLSYGTSWQDGTARAGIYMLSKTRIRFPLQGIHYAKNPVPTVNDWTLLWAAWDTVTQQMVPEQDLLAKPIELRNPIIFYLGHVPTFLDIHLSRALAEPMVEPYYATIFERGVDPDVDDPDVCHEHSKVPDEWPNVKEILQVQAMVRERVRKTYTSTSLLHPAVRRALWLGFEHEAMHLETLLYMLLQHGATVPPAGVVRPDFRAEAEASAIKEVPIQWFNVPERTVSIGFDEPGDAESGSYEAYGWDNEHPRRQVTVPAFRAAGRPITNGEYSVYLERTGRRTVPASWIGDYAESPQGSGIGNDDDDDSDRDGGGSTGRRSAVSASALFLRGKAVRTFFGPVPLRYALHWPVAASFEELDGYARWTGYRIPSREEVESLYVHTQPQDRRRSGRANAETVPAETLFIDLENTETGLRQWHPSPVTSSFRFSGRGQLGGVWEWTSSVLAPHEGFRPQADYRGYTADFFDSKHNIVLGGSWATHPRLAGRKTFVNWYQRNYPYVWAGARLVKDL